MTMMRVERVGALAESKALPFPMLKIHQTNISEERNDIQNKIISLHRHHKQVS